jgi:hypothetical protein
MIHHYGQIQEIVAMLAALVREEGPKRARELLLSTEGLDADEVERLFKVRRDYVL